MLSVIIPVYNRKHFLEKCINSIVMQKYKEIEIIIIDDGSDDGSELMCDNYERQYPNIRVIHQNHSGVVSARNTGIELATRKYVTFVDSDDYIDEDMYQVLMGEIGDCDLITSGLYRESGAVSYPNIDKIPEGEYEGINSDYFCSNFIYFENSSNLGLLPSLCTKIFRTEVLKKIYKNVDDRILQGEDTALCYLYILNCRKIKVTHEIFYHYIMHQGSKIHKNDLNFLHNTNLFYTCLYPFFKENDRAENLLYGLQKYVLNLVFTGINEKMDFDNRLKISPYVVPALSTINKKNIIVFGAGRIGSNYVQSIINQNIAKIVLWVDNDKKNSPLDLIDINEPSQIKSVEYDYILIAVKYENVASKIRQQLLAIGVIEEKILWEEPRMIWGENGTYSN